MRYLKFVILLLIFSCSSKKLEKSYYDSGELKVEYEMANGKKNGLSRFYYKNGSLQTEVNYVNDKEEGDLKTYYKSGDLKNESFFKEGKLFGTSKFYYEDGTLMETQTYDKRGVLVDFHKYDPAGNKKIEAMTPIFYPKYDTVNLNNEYEIEIRLANKVHDSVKVIIGELNENGYLTDTSEVLKRNILNGFAYKFTPKKKGTNSISGIIENYEYRGDTLDSYSVPFYYSYTAE